MSTTFPRNPAPEPEQVALIRAKYDEAAEKYDAADNVFDRSTWATEKRLMRNWLWAYAPESLPDWRAA